MLRDPLWMYSMVIPYSFGIGLTADCDRIEVSDRHPPRPSGGLCQGQKMSLNSANTIIVPSSASPIAMSTFSAQSPGGLPRTAS